MSTILIGIHAVEIPSVLDTPEFLTELGEFLAYRRKEGKPIRSEIGLKRLLKKLAKYGPIVAAAALDQAMSCGWQGVFPEKMAATAQAAEQSMFEQIDEATR